MRRIAVIMACVLACVLVACGSGNNRSWSSLATTNGFSGPVELNEDRGDGELVLVVGYGRCRIRLLTHKPWYENYTSTYLPVDTALASVEQATAYKLAELPQEYKLDDCVDTITR